MKENKGTNGDNENNSVASNYVCVLGPKIQPFGIFEFILLYIMLHITSVLLPISPILLFGILSTKLWMISVVLLPALMIHCMISYRREELTDGRPWTPFADCFILAWLRKYMPMSLHIHASLRDKEPFQCIVAMHPHGVYAEWRIMLDGLIHTHLHFLREWRVLAAGVLFFIPFVREVALWSHCVDAGRATAEYNLKQKRSIMLVPGGEAEQLRTAHGRDGPLYLRARTGFVRLAIRHGVPIVPVYVFGCSDLYRTSAIAIHLRKLLVRTLRICIVVAWGAGSPAVPLRTPLHVVFGEPFDPRAFLACRAGGAVAAGPEKGAAESRVGGDDLCEPPREDVLAALEEYERRLVQLYDENKGRFGYGDRRLEIA